MFFFSKKPERPIILFNTATKTKEAFAPLTKGVVKMYTCGPTVYDVAHIGNLRAALFPDVIRRVLEYAGYRTTSVINITDFGHLTDDTASEDKMTLALRREELPLSLENMKLVAEKYTEVFLSDLKELQVKNNVTYPRASDHVQGMIAYIQVLQQKGYAYTTSDGIYFDTKKFERYGALGGSSSAEHSRVGVSQEKKNPQDFSLWKNDERGWKAPWGTGFPGWHIECVAMATRYLGKTFDIHAGGMDLIPIHHNNEIAEAEAANAKPYARYWLHNEFLTIDGQKISKSLGNTVSLQNIRDQGIHPLAFRYWLLTGHYRQKMNFTWDALAAAQTTLQRAWRLYAELPAHGGVVAPTYRAEFEEALYDDLNTPQAVAVVWSVLKDEQVAPEDKRATLEVFDGVLGIGFDVARRQGSAVSVSVVSRGDIPEAVEALIAEREQARKAKDFTKADELRQAILSEGFVVEDMPRGPVVKRGTL